MTGNVSCVHKYATCKTILGKRNCLKSWINPLLSTTSLEHHLTLARESLSVCSFLVYYVFVFFHFYFVNLPLSASNLFSCSLNGETNLWCRNVFFFPSFWCEDLVLFLLLGKMRCWGKENAVQKILLKLRNESECHEFFLLFMIGLKDLLDDAAPDAFNANLTLLCICSWVSGDESHIATAGVASFLAFKLRRNDRKKFIWVWTIISVNYVYSGAIKLAFDKGRVMAMDRSFFSMGKDDTSRKISWVMERLD